MDKNWDVIIAGGGAAGLSAALTLGRSLRRVLVLDTGLPRNRYAAHMHSVLGNEGLDPAELIARGREEAAAYGVEYADEPVTGVAADDDGVSVTTTDATLRARMLLVATGVRDELPDDIPGLQEHWGTGVLHCPYCHGWEVRGRRLGVLGLSPMSLHQAELIRQWSDDLTFFTGAIEPVDPAALARLRARGVTIEDSPVTAVIGEDAQVTGVSVADGRTIAVDALFTGGVLCPRDEFLGHLGLERRDTPVGSFLAVDAMGRTSHPRIWAAGNVVEPMANVPISIAAGVTAGSGLNMALVTEEFDAAEQATGGEVPAGASDPATHWEGRYTESDQIWSGRVNATTADVVRGLPLRPGSKALDLGCGEGGDAVWLAEQGWTVTAVDISPTAVARGAKGAAGRGVADQITWVSHDLASWRTEDSFDLVTASFFHSNVELPRTEVLRRAAGRIRPGGHLLVVSHVFESDDDIPPWADNREPEDTEHDQGHGHGHGHGHYLPAPAEELAELALDPAHWRVWLQEVRRREATSPDGTQQAQLKDGVILLERLAD